MGSWMGVRGAFLKGDCEGRNRKENTQWCLNPKHIFRHITFKREYIWTSSIWKMKDGAFQTLNGCLSVLPTYVWKHWSRVVFISLSYFKNIPIVGLHTRPTIFSNVPRLFQCTIPMIMNPCSRQGCQTHFYWGPHRPHGCLQKAGGWAPCP